MSVRLEQRAVTELRVSGRRLEGYAAVFNSPAKIGSFTETIEPGAFRNVILAKKDIIAMVDHDTGRVLARTRSGTLRLSEDAKGLAFSLDVPDTQIGRDTLALAERGDLGGMSFGFKPADEAWPSRDRRILRAIDLHEISVVSAWPAYNETTVEARAIRPLPSKLRRALMFLETCNG